MGERWGKQSTILTSALLVRYMKFSIVPARTYTTGCILRSIDYGP